jgi:ribosomal protein S11
MGIIQVKKTKNNLFIILRDSNNKLLTISSLGVMGFKTEGKKTYYAYYKLAEKMGIKALEFNIKGLTVEFLGAPLHKKAIISPLEKLSFKINLIIFKDLTKHGGCRFKKKRRK